MKNKKIVMCGCHETGIEMLDYLLSHDIKITHFVSLTQEQAKKYNVSGYASFERISKKYNIPIYYAKEYSLKHKEDVEFFVKQNFDLLLLGGWQRLIPKEILDTLKIGGLGFHGSSEFLPKGRGRSPVNWSLIEGKRQFILHLYFLSEGVDDGDVLAHKMFDINHWDTCRTVNYKVSIVTKQLMVEQIKKIFSGDFNSVPQLGEPSYYPKRSPEDGEIDWEKSFLEIYNFVRALTKPYPGAFTYLNGEKITFWVVQPFDSQISYNDVKIGEVVEVFFTGDFVVNCNSGLLLVTESDAKPQVGDIFSSKSNVKN